jgi:formylglycine-generating enzyme required for sulfatase activity
MRLLRLQLAITTLLITGCASLFLAPNTQHLTSNDMVYIPAGWFVMGSSQEDGQIGFEIGVDELPQQKVYVQGFYIDRYEVTEEEYHRYLLATEQKKYPGYWKEAGRADRYTGGYERHPVSDVDWYDAKEYCRWMGKRLPTEAEWEKAARGSDGRLWPWGSEFVAGQANTGESSQLWKAPEGQKGNEGWKAPVGSHPNDVSPYGVYDMAGNVREWTASSYRSYTGNTVKSIVGSDRFKILRGGSYMTPAIFSRTAVRVAVLPSVGPRETDGWHSDYTYGFRCAKDAG